MFLREGNRIGSLQYKTLHFALNAVLGRTGVRFADGAFDFRDYESVVKMLETFFALRFRTARGAEVADEIPRLHFHRQVAICDVGNGDHSILLNGKSECGNSLLAFDPWWYDDNRTDNNNAQFPGESCTNVRICMRHLLEDPLDMYLEEYNTGKAYPMGMNIEKRFLTVIEPTR